MVCSGILTTCRAVLAMLFLTVGFVTQVFAADVIAYHGYTQAVELKNDSTRVVLCPEVGGRVLEYSHNATNVLYLSQAEKDWKPGVKPQSSAGRFDIGPEYIIPRRDVLWSGPWQAEITGQRSARMSSQKDSATGVQLIRDFKLAADSSHLSCRQTIVNVSQETKEWCHWSRTFAVGKGICIIPLTEKNESPQSRFPNGYVMYEGRKLINVLPDDSQIRRRQNVLEIHPTPAHPKLGFDSYAGVIAYVAPNDLLFVKRFATYPERVYNEAAGLTISVWYPDNQMVELEPIGPREVIAPGASASFTEDWFLTPMTFPGAEASVDLDALNMRLKSLSKSRGQE